MGLPAHHCLGDDARMSTPGPAKKWRVTWQGNSNSKDHRSQPSAYEQVQSLTGRGVKVAVYHWRDGGWQLYERCDPAGG